MIRVALPRGPSANALHRRVGRRTLLSRKARAYREAVRSVLVRKGIKPMDGSLKVHIQLYPPDRRKRDCDNYQKSILDSLEHGGAFHDDSQITRLITDKMPCVPGGMVVVTIEECEKWNSENINSMPLAPSTNT